MDRYYDFFVENQIAECHGTELQIVDIVDNLSFDNNFAFGNLVFDLES
jgi:hypothetical protein